MPVAEIIDRRGLPFLFVNGYGSGGQPEAFIKRPALQKPLMLSKLGETIDSILSSADAHATEKRRELRRSTEPRWPTGAVASLAGLLQISIPILRQVDCQSGLGQLQHRAGIVRSWRLRAAIRSKDNLRSKAFATRP